MMALSSGSKGNPTISGVTNDGMHFRNNLGLTLPPRLQSREVAHEATQAEGPLIPNHDHYDSDDSLDSLFNEPRSGDVKHICAVHSGFDDPQWLVTAKLNQALTDVNALRDLLQASAEPSVVSVDARLVKVFPKPALTQDDPRTSDAPDCTPGPDVRGAPQAAQVPPSPTHRVVRRIAPSTPNVSVDDDYGDIRSVAGGECQRQLTFAPPSKISQCLILRPQDNSNQPPQLLKAGQWSSETASERSRSRKSSPFTLSRSWTRHFPSAKSSTSRHSNHPNSGVAATLISCDALSSCISLPSSSHLLSPLQSSTTKIKTRKQKKMIFSPHHSTFAKACTAQDPAPFPQSPLSPVYPDLNPSNLNEPYSLNGPDDFLNGTTFETGIDLTDDLPFDPTVFDKYLNDSHEHGQVESNNEFQAVGDPLFERGALDAGVGSDLGGGCSQSQDDQINYREQYFQVKGQYLEAKERLDEIQNELRHAETKIKTLEAALNHRSPSSDRLSMILTPRSLADESRGCSPNPTPIRLSDDQKRLNKRLSNDNWRLRKAEKESLKIQFGQDSAQYKAAVSKLQTRTGRISKAGGKTNKHGMGYLGKLVDTADWDDGFGGLRSSFG